MTAFYTLKHKVKSGTDTSLLARIVQAKKLTLPTSTGALNQFEVVHRDLARQAKKDRDSWLREPRRLARNSSITVVLLGKGL